MAHSLFVSYSHFHFISTESSSPPACSQGQTAVSLHCDTWVIQGQPLNGTAETRVLRLVHWIHAWGTEKQSEECRSGLRQDSLFRKHWLHLLYSLVKQHALKGFYVWLRAQWCRAILSIQLGNEQNEVSYCILFQVTARETARSNWRRGHFLPANTIALAGLNPGRASTGCSWRYSVSPIWASFTSFIPAMM